MMYPALLFHSFNNTDTPDKFYDLDMKKYISLIDFLSNKIEPKKLTITFDDGFRSIIPAIEYALKKGCKTIAFYVTISIRRHLKR